MANYLLLNTDAIMNDNIKRKKELFLKTYNNNRCERVALCSGYITATRRINTYSKDVSDDKKVEIKHYWMDKLRELGEKYKVEQEEKQFFKDVLFLRSVMNKKFPYEFRNPKCPGFRIAHAQKSLAVYLKHLWCMGRIPEPPVCPLDATIIGKAWENKNLSKQEKHQITSQLDKNKNGRLLHAVSAWGHIDTEKEYYTKLEILNIARGELTLAQWELLNFEIPNKPAKPYSCNMRN